MNEKVDTCETAKQDDAKRGEEVWGRIHHEQEKKKRFLLIFTIISLLLSVPHSFSSLFLPCQSFIGWLSIKPFIKIFKLIWGQRQGTRRNSPKRTHCYKLITEMECDERSEKSNLFICFHGDVWLSASGHYQTKRRVINGTLWRSRSQASTNFWFGFQQCGFLTWKSQKNWVYWDWKAWKVQKINFIGFES